MFYKKLRKSKQNADKSVGVAFPATVFGFYWSVVRRFPLFYSVVGIALISGFLLDRVMFPYTNKWAVQIFESAAQGAWNEKLLWIAGLYLAIFAIGAVRQYMNLHWRPIVARYTSFALYKRVYKNDTDFFISRPAGQVTSQISTVAGNLNKMTLEFYTDVINFSVGMLLLSVGIFLENFWFAVLIAIGAVLRTGWRFIWQRKINAQQKILQDISSRISGMRTDSLGNAMTAKLFVLMAEAQRNTATPPHIRELALQVSTIEQFVSIIEWGQQEGTIREGSPRALSNAFWCSIQGVAEYYVELCGYRSL